jgi:nucleoid-associated protein YgaU
MSLRVRTFLLVVFLAMAGTGCERLFDKGTKQSAEEAAKKAAAGDYPGAVLLYEASLDGTVQSADIHYRLALIYADKLQRPVDALHHFNRYLELLPTGPHAKEAQAYQPEGDQALMTALANGSPFTQSDAVKLKNENLALRSALANLRAQRAQVAAFPAAGGRHGEEQQKPIPQGARTHTVGSGETLASIAVKYYKNKARYREIQEANFYPMEGTPKLKPGMVLAIP